MKFESAAAVQSNLMEKRIKYIRGAAAHGEAPEFAAVFAERYGTGPGAPVLCTKSSHVHVLRMRDGKMTDFACMMPTPHGWTVHDIYCGIGMGGMKSLIAMLAKTGVRISDAWREVRTLALISGYTANRWDAIMTPPPPRRRPRRRGRSQSESAESGRQRELKCVESDEYTICVLSAHDEKSLVTIRVIADALGFGGCAQSMKIDMYRVMYVATYRGKMVGAMVVDTRRKGRKDAVMVNMKTTKKDAPQLFAAIRPLIRISVRYPIGRVVGVLMRDGFDVTEIGENATNEVIAKMSIAPRRGRLDRRASI